MLSNQQLSVQEQQIQKKRMELTFLESNVNELRQQLSVKEVDVATLR